MHTLNSTLFVILAAVAMAFAWGIRGSFVGHQKASMWTGMITFLCIAFFSGVPQISERYWNIAAAAGLGCYFGGIMSYAQTKRIFGYFLKGGLWIGLGGAFAGLALAGTSVYKLYDYAIILAAIIILRKLGRRLFDRPFDPENNIFPRFYFSRNKEEQWGGLLLTLIFILLYAAGKGDFITVAMISITFLGGGTGLCFGTILRDAAIHSNIFGRFSKYIDTGKISECTFGAIAGMSMAIGFLTVKPMLPDFYPEVIDPKFSEITVYIWAALIIFYEIARHVSEAKWEKSTGKGSPELAVKGLYWVDRAKVKEEYGDVSREAPSFLITKRVQLSFAFYCYIPAFFVLLSCYEWAEMICGPLFLFMFFHETVRTQLKGYKYVRQISAIYTLTVIGAFIYEICVGFIAWQLIALYLITCVSLMILLWGFVGERILGKRYSCYPKKGQSFFDAYGGHTATFAWFFVCAVFIFSFFIPTI